jgi:REP element-mobilizing transposase RayT
VHALLDLPTHLSIEECIKLLKGASSFYINKQKVINTKFSWGKGYGAFSVSPSLLDKVITYIKNQEEHHRVKTFTEEFELFSKNYGIVKEENG